MHEPHHDPADSSVPLIAVVIPTYRAEAYIGTVLAGIPGFVSFIIVVDDCSPDRSAELARGCGDARVSVLSNASNLGVGGSVLAGYRLACELGAEIIVKMDSDGQMDPAYLISLIAPIIAGQADYTKGNRFAHAEQLRSMPFWRRVGNAGLSFLTKAASGYWNVFDPTNGYTAIHASLIPQLDVNKIHPRYFFESSMLIELGFLRAVISDVEIPARYARESSSLSEWQVLFEFPPLLLAGFLRRIAVQYFVRDFGIFSMLLVLGTILCAFGLTFGTYHWIISSRTFTFASTGTVMIAVLPLILGSQLIIQTLVVDIQNIPQQPLQAKNKLIKAIKARLRA